jgi:nucleotide-binding universal stress UspA family protein
MRGTNARTQPVTYERIVVPLDGSEVAERALPHALSLARAIRAPVHLIRVVDITPLTLVSPVGLGVEQAAYFAALEGLDAEEETASEYLEEIRRGLKEFGIDVSIEVDRGLVVPTLLDAVRTQDLLTMTTHGRTGLKRWFFGSVAEELIRRSTAPILLIRSHDEEKEQTEEEINM